jgi:hypothetical protein
MRHRNAGILWCILKCATKLKFSGVTTVAHSECATKSKYGAPLMTCFPSSVPSFHKGGLQQRSLEGDSILDNFMLYLTGRKFSLYFLKVGLILDF